MGCHQVIPSERVACNLIERSFNKIKQCQRARLDMTSSRLTIFPSSGPHQFAFGCVLMSPRPGLGRWTYRLYGVGVAGSAEGEFDLVPRLQLRKINRRNDREFHLHCRPVDGGDRTMIECDLVV